MGDLPATNGHGPQSDSNGGSTNFTVKAGLAKMLKGGVIMDVVNAEQVGFQCFSAFHAMDSNR